MNPPPSARAADRLAGLAAGNQERIRLRILIPLILAIGTLLTAFALGIHEEQRRANERSIRRTAQAVRRLLAAEQQERTETMIMTIQQLVNDDRLGEALRVQDRAALIERTRPLFENLRRIYKITHFYFDSPARINVLRVHAPERSGDTINDDALLAAERTGQIVSALQQGALGEFVLRVISPWRRDGRLLGYVELGIDFEDIIKKIHDQLDVDLFVVLDKSALKREEWEQARRASAKQAAWEQFPFAVVTDKTLDTVPEPARIYLRRDRKVAARADEVLYWKGGVTQIVFLPLKDLDAKAPGELIVMRDISQAMAETRESVWTIALICAGVSAALLAFFYVFLGRIERKLTYQTTTLNAEIAQRQAAQQDLREANERLEERVVQRTRELQTANAKLLAAQQQLVETSRQAGMAEVATAVLHNVGNVLNSVNVSSSVLANKVRSSKVASVADVAELLQAHAADLPGFFASRPGKHLTPYLTSLAEHLAREQKDLLQELHLLGSNVEHINAIVAMQQNYPKVVGVPELHPAAALLEDALRVNSGPLQHQQIQVIREYAEVPPVLVDKHQVLQILVNLIRNAEHALVESDRPDKRLTLRLANSPGCVRLSITDNGVGIPPENLTRIFNHGFSTRKDGHGFGLHSGALAAKALGGALTVCSDGPGKGAAFTLELPCQAKAK